MRRLLLAANEDDAWEWIDRHYGVAAADAVVWPSRFHKLGGQQPFDRMSITAKAFGMSAAIAACLTRVKGPDGLTPGQRLNADEIGARMREVT